MNLNIENFTRLRQHIADNVSEERIWMDWYIKDLPSMCTRPTAELCGNAGCIYGHCALAFSGLETLSTGKIIAFSRMFLNIQGESHVLINAIAWPKDLQDAYANGARKAAVLARLDRVIERGDLD